MKRLIGSNVFARHAAEMAPRELGYRYVPAGYGQIPGFVVSGPDMTSKTTVCLVDGDDGAWFRALVAGNGGVVEEI